MTLFDLIKNIERIKELREMKRLDSWQWNEETEQELDRLEHTWLVVQPDGEHE